MKNMKKALCLFLAFVMCLGMLPAPAFAADSPAPDQAVEGTPAPEDNQVPAEGEKSLDAAPAGSEGSTDAAPAENEGSADETPDAVKAFLDAVAALPSADEVTADNAVEIGEQVNAAFDLYEAIEDETEEVTEAFAAAYAVFEAVLAAEEVEESETYGSSSGPDIIKTHFWNNMGNKFYLSAYRSSDTEWVADQSGNEPYGEVTLKDNEGYTDAGPFYVPTKGYSGGLTYKYDGSNVTRILGVTVYTFDANGDVVEQGSFSPDSDGTNLNDRYVDLDDTVRVKANWTNGSASSAGGNPCNLSFTFKPSADTGEYGLYLVVEFNTVTWSGNVSLTNRKCGFTYVVNSQTTATPTPTPTRPNNTLTNKN